MGRSLVHTSSTVYARCMCDFNTIRMMGPSGSLWLSLHIMTRLNHPPTTLHCTSIMDFTPGKKAHVVKDELRQPRNSWIGCEGYVQRLRRLYGRQHLICKEHMIIDVLHPGTIKLETESGWKQLTLNLIIQLRNSMTNIMALLLSSVNTVNLPINSNYLRPGKLSIRFSMSVFSLPTLHPNSLHKFDPPPHLQTLLQE